MPSGLRILRSNIFVKRYSFRSLSTIPQPLPLEPPIEEETLPHYNAAHFYPVKIGDIYLDRYQISGKLGYGAYSTSWLARDLHTNIFATLKVSTYLPGHPTVTERELKVYEHLPKILPNSTHPGQSLIREVYDSFDLRGTSGRHACIVMQPMHMTLFEMMKLNSRPFGLPLLKMTVRRLLLALDFLHTEAGAVHTDLKTANIMITIQDDEMLSEFARAEAEDPSPQKVIDSSRTIYTSRSFCPPYQDKGYGLPMLCDFGEARIGRTHESGPFVQPHIYRAPEVIFEMPWGSAVDIWNLAGVIWDLFEGEHLFDDIFDSKGRYDAFKHLALMVALIGQPPSEFVRRSETAEQCFDSSGAWIAQGMERIPNISLETRESRLAGTGKELFLAFITSMLKWMPEERMTAKQLLGHPFMQE